MTHTKPTSMCFDCMKQRYGEPKRSLGGITVSMNTCPICKKKDSGIVPARDIAFAYKNKLTVVDKLLWD